MSACISSCKHICVRLKGFLKADEVKQMNVNGLKHFKADLQACLGTLFIFMLLFQAKNNYQVNINSAKL